ncbi:MAG TPA: hypothetical protein VNZ53_02790, partial [Steroidobacteraceae bacterium]|nr:hypothetical protein [Steroidobacteraceae bacterium]
LRPGVVGARTRLHSFRTPLRLRGVSLGLRRMRMRGHAHSRAVDGREAHCSRRAACPALADRLEVH